MVPEVRATGNGSTFWPFRAIVSNQNRCARLVAVPHAKTTCHSFWKFVNYADGTLGRVFLEMKANGVFIYGMDLPCLIILSCHVTDWRCLLDIKWLSKSTRFAVKPTNTKIWRSISEPWTRFAGRYSNACLSRHVTWASCGIRAHVDWSVCHRRVTNRSRHFHFWCCREKMRR